MNKKVRTDYVETVSNWADEEHQAMVMRLPIYQVDAFSDALFAGNPAAVVLCRSPLTAALMQSIAAENNLAETAFVNGELASLFIRWFTPAVKVDLCGHATLAAAHVLFEKYNQISATLSFNSRSGMLPVRKSNGLLWLDFPADRLSRVADPPRQLIEGLGARVREVYRGRTDYLAILENESAVSELKPDLSALSRLACRGVIASAQGTEVDFVSRFFAPQSGIAEDPATGSAHTTLTGYWSNRLGKKELQARQLSPRGGTLFCVDRTDRIDIGGNAVTYMLGEIMI